MTCWLNSPVKFTSNSCAKEAMTLVHGPQIRKVEADHGYVKVTWADGTISLAPAWWFVNGQG